MNATTASNELPADLGRVHFIGIGGAGMSGIAHLMAARGLPVTGSDQSESANVLALREIGVDVAIGHDARHVAGAETVVISSAVHEGNPELAAARAAGLRVIHRSQALEWLTHGHRVIAVAGAHGKSTSTGMLITALRELGADPSFVNGAIIKQLGTNAGWGDSDLFVLEADESDGSFLRYHTAGVLVTNIDTEHLDHYGSAQAIEDAFVDFITGAAEFSVVNASDRLTRAILPRLGSAQQLVTFGETGDGNDLELRSVTPEGWHTDVEVGAGEGRSVHFRSDLIGHHNALNVLGVAAVLRQLGYPLADALHAAGHYQGTSRRFDRQGTVNGVTVVDDYAHHPTEVAAVLSAAHELAGEGRVLVIFEPHLYSRTRDHADEFAAVFGRWADFVSVVELRGAREDPLPSIDSAWLVSRFADADLGLFSPTWDDAIDQIAARARPGDIVLTLGVGLYPILPGLLERLRDR